MSLAFRYLFSLIFLFLVFLVNAQDVRSVLEKSLQAVNEQKQLNYNYELELNYPSEDYRSLLQGKVFLDFEVKNPLGFTYQFQNDDTKIVYNGSECFSLNIPKQTINIIRQPNLKDLTRFTFLNNTPLTLKNSISEIVKSENYQFTLDDNVSNEDLYKVDVLLGQNILGKMGEISPISVERNVKYSILIDKGNYLPVEITQTNDVSIEDFVKTKFRFTLDRTMVPSEESWYFSTYSGFSPEKEIKRGNLTMNEVVPDWKLPDVINSAVVDLSKYRGKYVLLEFWIKNCGYCISAVSKINKIQETYKKKGLHIIGINAGDSLADALKFITRNNVNYLNVWDKDNVVSNSFGVYEYPKVMLLDKQGKLIYQGAINSDKLDELLESL